MNWIELPNNELLKFLKDIWYLKYTKLIGKLVKRGDLMFFTDIRSHEFRKIEYPDNQYNREINILFTPENNSVLNLDVYYEFYFGIRDVEKRILKNRLSIFYVLKKNVIEIKPKAFIETRNKVYTGINVELADTIRKAIKTLTSDINREPETFIYELLQNADDYPLEKNSVEIKFTITSNYLLLSHNGQPFNFQNVYALTGISQGDKRENKETIGFKGVGFKSIFKDSKFAIIKSGGFEFKFDESCFPRDAKRPWQIIPIWVENYDSELLNEQDFINGNVAIAIKPIEGDEKLRTIEKSYKNILSKVFRDDRILIFLRRIEKVIIKDSLDTEYNIEINKNKEKWFISNGLKNVVVQDSIRQWINKKIEDEEITIPEKFKDIGETKITFAVERSGDILTGTNDSKIYTYLPTEIDFGFKFLINGDFIPDGSRTELHDNEWNNYLAKLTGVKFVEWLYILGNNTWVDFKGNKKQFDRNYIDLIPDFNDPKALASGKNQFFLDSFKEGFESAIIGSEAIKFIPIKSGDLEFLSNILIDETGLAELLGDEFSQLTGISEKLIDSNVGEGVEKIKDLIKQNDVGVIYDKDRLKDDIQTKLQDWLKKPSNNFKFIQYINSSDVLKGLLKSEEIILSESLLLQKASALYFEVPKEITFLAVDKVNSEVLTLLTDSKINLSLTEFEPVDFFKNNIFSKQENINASLADETNLLNFWKFIFDNWTLFEADTAIKDSFKHFVVLCKPKTENELSKKVISSAYLSNEFNSTNDIEIVVKDISPDEVFISDKYIDKKREAEKWRKIFKQAGAITDLQKVIEVLLPKLPIIESAKHLEIAKQIFKFWKDPANKLTDAQIVLIKTNLNIKCIDKKFRKSTDCIISDHYNNNQLIASWLPNLELANQVAQEYAPRTNQVAEWKNFFEIIGCVELTDKQNVFDAKINFIIASQDTLKDNHFEILKSISDLFKLNKENGLIFDFEKTLSQIKLQTNNDQLHLPVSIHLSSSYKPKLNLENDDIINSKLLFLNEKYLPNEIEKFFFIKLGVKNNFSFNNIEIVSFENFENLSIKDKLFNSENFNVKKNTLLSRGYNIKSIEAYTKFKNHVQCYFLSVPVIQKYNSLFFDEVVKLNDKFFNHTELINNQSSCGSCHNELINFIRENETIENKLGVFVKPSMLFSSKLEKYIDDKSLIPKNNLLCTEFKSEKSIAEIIGIYQELSIELCLYLLSNPSVELTFKEIQELNVVKILSNYRPKEEGDTKIFMLNKIAEWKSINELLISNDEKIKIEPSQQLHEDFLCLADNFGVQELSERSLILITKPEKPLISYEINEFFEKKAKYIAFKIDPLNFEVLETEIIERIVSIKFYEAEFISKVFPEYNPIYNVELDFSFEEEEKIIFYKDNWKTNIQVIEFLFNQIKSEKVEYAWFKNIISWDDKKIIETLINISDSVPNDWMNIDSKEGEDEEEAEFLKFYREGLTRAKAHWRSLANHGESFNDYFLKTFTDVLQSNKSLKLGTQISNDLSKKDQKEANREAKVIVKEKLESEGFEFTNSIDEFSTINGVKKEGIEYPLVVKSYKNQDEPLKIGANEWIQLMHPNSMFWVYFGNDKIACLKLNELLRKQDNLTISFSTENLDVENRLEKFAELLRYFGDVHFDFHSVKPNNYSTATVMGSYQFTERKTEEDLSRDDQELL